MLAAIASGWVQQQIHEAAYRWQSEVESGERIVVGVNRFVEDEPAPAAARSGHDPAVERRPRRVPCRLAGRARSRQRARRALARLERRPRAAATT